MNETKINIVQFNNYNNLICRYAIRMTMLALDFYRFHYCLFSWLLFRFALKKQKHTKWFAVNEFKLLGENNSRKPESVGSKMNLAKFACKIIDGRQFSGALV